MASLDTYLSKIKLLGGEVTCYNDWGILYNTPNREVRYIDYSISYAPRKNYAFGIIFEHFILLCDINGADDTNPMMPRSEVIVKGKKRDMLPHSYIIDAPTTARYNEYKNEILITSAYTDDILNYLLLLINSKGKKLNITREYGVKPLGLKYKIQKTSKGLYKISFEYTEQPVKNVAKLDNRVIVSIIVDTELNVVSKRYMNVC